MKRYKKLTSVILCVALLASSIIVSGALPTSAAGENAVANTIGYGETYTFDFDNVIEYKANTDSATDADGNVFYPWRSADDNATAKKATITYGGEEISALELSASGNGMYIPTDENGQPLVLEPNATYRVQVTSYALALGPWKQFFLGGGIYEANKPEYSNGGSKTFPESIAWNNATYDMTALYPLYRTGAGQYAGETAVYFPNYRQQKDAVFYFNTGDYDPKNGLITALASDGECYKFANYFGVFFNAGSVATDDYTGNQVIYYDSISITKTAGMEVGESYTFDFNEGEVGDYAVNSTPSVDGEGNTFYPLHASSKTGYAASVTQENIDIITKDGGSDTISALRLEAPAALQYIPTDENGLPFVVEPNAKYQVEIKSYAKNASTWIQFFPGAGTQSAQNQSFNLTHESWYYVDGSQNGVAKTDINSSSPIFRTLACQYQDWGGNVYTSATSTSNTARYYDTFDEGNSRQCKTETSYFLTSDFTETLSGETDTNGNNVFVADLWPSVGSDRFTQANVGTYFALTCYGGTFTPYDKSTQTALTESPVPVVFYIDYIKITKVSQTASVTFDANGGSFSDQTTAKTEAQNVGSAFSVEEPVNANPDLIFLGWSLTKDGKKESKVEAHYNGKTLYAVWGTPSPHPEDGVYDSWKRTIEFDQYKVNGYNTFYPTGEDYEPYSGVSYFKVVDDPDEAGDKLLHFYNHSAAGSWTANWSITPTPTGETNTNSDEASGLVLPTATTFKMTFRIRMNSTGGGTPSIAMFYGTTFGSGSLDVNKTRTSTVTLKSGIAASDNWQDIEVFFTTPDEYEVFENGSTANRLYVGVLCAGYKMDYDLDYIKLEKATNTNLYVKENGVYVLKDTISGCPGEAFDLPEFYGTETYSLYDATGSDSKMLYGNWFSDEECTSAAVLKYGNYDVDLYCDAVTAVPSVSTENQEMFVGFDTYTQRTEGLKNAVITDATCNSGSYSLKASDGAAFELKNDYTFEVTEGKTYRVDFAYKADKEATFNIGLAEGVVANGVTTLNTVALAAADEWTNASVVFTADGALDNSILAATVTGATVHIDTMIVSSATESVGVEAVTDAALRFMLSYNGDTVKMAGVDYTVTEHGVIVKGQDVNTALTLDNADKAGIFHFAQNDMSKNWSVNPVTGTTVYSAYLDGFNADDDYKVSVRGYVKFENGDVFYTDTLTASVTDIPAAADIIPEDADLSSYYVYLPEGTTLPEDAAYTVTTYDDTFTANSAVENNVVTVGSYAVFSARPDFSEINVPDELKYTVHAGTKDELYYGLNAQVVSEKISEVGKDTVNYLFVTDIHFGYDLTSAQSVSLLNQAKLMTKMANENDDIDFVVIGGDTTTGMYGSKETAIKWTQAALDPFLECQKPVFVLMGNHDDNSYHLLDGTNTNAELYEERIITDLDWQNYIIDRYVNKGNIQVVQDDPAKRANSKYFYYDLEGKKTRVIALDALDYEAKYDENGYVLGDLDGDGFLDGMPVKNAEGTTDSAKYYAGTSYWGYSADQIRWLAEDALGSLPADYDVIFVSHMGMDQTTNSYWSKIWFGSDIREIVRTFNAGGSYTASLTDNWGDAVSVSANFAGKNGDILSWQFGHQHIELSLYESDVDLWQISTSTASVANAKQQTEELLLSSSVNNKGLPWRVYTRKLGTSSEACFNAMSVSSERLYRLTVGEGNNEKLIYPN